MELSNQMSTIDSRPCCLSKDLNVGSLTYCTRHIVRMEDNRPPEQLFCGELNAGNLK